MGLTRSIWKCNLGCKSKYGKYLWFKHPQDLVDHYNKKHPIEECNEKIIGDKGNK